MTYKYRSALRPIDWMYMKTEEGTTCEPDWDAMPPPPFAWTPSLVYAFKQPIAGRIVNQWSLEVVGDPVRDTAPELLKALKDLVERFEPTFMSDISAIEDAKAIIAKAEGK